jgi:hypothetical protein
MRRMVLVLMVAAFAFPAVASAHDVEVFPPGSNPYGKTYGQWSAEWWKQAVRETGAPGTPFASGRVDCGRLGTRDVVFLVGTAGGDVVRFCTIPAGKALLIPLVNAECSHGEGNGDTEAELRECARMSADSVDVENLYLKIDSLRSLGGLSAFRFASPLFTFDAVPGNVFAPAIPPGRSPAVADGYYVMVKPLDRGLHIIAFGGTAADGAFETNALYVLKVRR